MSTTPNIQLYHGDCLEVMPSIPDASVDMILCDLPYGTTACKWDTIIPLEPLWKEYKRIIKRNGAIVLTASQPFTTTLIASNITWFKYEWIWRKTVKGGALDAPLRPLKEHENVLVFSNYGVSHGTKNRMVYYPQGLRAIERTCRSTKTNRVNYNGNFPSIKEIYTQRFTNYPASVLEFGSETGYHPTQKPVALMEYLIRTYTNEGETVLDNTMGSGTTLVACVNTGRNGIGIERDAGYFQIATERIHKAQVTPRQLEIPA